MNRKLIVPASLALLLTACAARAGEAAPSLPYKDDPRIIAMLQGLGDSSAVNLPYERDNRKHTGRSSNDYSMRMAYSCKHVKDKLLALAVFDPAKNAWVAPEIKGAPLPTPKYEGLMGFFPPVQNAYVIVAGGWTPTWVYRYKKAPLE